MGIVGEGEWGSPSTRLLLPLYFLSPSGLSPSRLLSLSVLMGKCCHTACFALAHLLPACYLPVSSILPGSRAACLPAFSCPPRLPYNSLCLPATVALICALPSSTLLCQYTCHMLLSACMPYKGEMVAGKRQRGGRRIDMRARIIRHAARCLSPPLVCDTANDVGRHDASGC